MNERLDVKTDYPAEKLQHARSSLRASDRMNQAPYLPPVMTTCVIDVSHWQGARIDWQAVAAENPWIVGVIAKATQGANGVDPAWPWNSVEIPKAGLLLAAYHYMTDEPVHAQADHLLRFAADAWPRIDLEWNASSSPDVPRAADLVGVLYARLGYHPVLYMSRFGPDRKGGGLPDNTLSQCDLWLPEYGAAPICPVGWDEWKLWQVTDAGHVAGIAAPVDISIFAGTADECRAWWVT